MATQTDPKTLPMAAALAAIPKKDADPVTDPVTDPAQGLPMGSPLISTSQPDVVTDNHAKMGLLQQIGNGASALGKGALYDLGYVTPGAPNNLGVAGADLVKNVAASGALNSFADLKDAYTMGGGVAANPLLRLNKQYVEQPLRNLGTAVKDWFTKPATAAPLANVGRISNNPLSGDPNDVNNPDDPQTGSPVAPVVDPRTVAGQQAVQRVNPFVTRQMDLITQNAAKIEDPTARENYIKYSTAGVNNVQSAFEQTAMNKVYAAAGLVKTDPNTGISYTSDYDPKTGAPVAPQTAFQKEGIAPTSSVDAAGHVLQSYQLPNGKGTVSTYQDSKPVAANPHAGMIDVSDDPDKENWMPGRQANQQLAENLLRRGIINPDSQASRLPADQQAQIRYYGVDPKTPVQVGFNEPSITAPASAPDTSVTSSGLPTAVTQDPKALFNVVPRSSVPSVAAETAPAIAAANAAATKLPKDNFVAKIEAKRALERAVDSGGSSPDPFVRYHTSVNTGAAIQKLADANNDHDHPERYAPFDPTDPANPTNRAALASLYKSDPSLMAQILAEPNTLAGGTPVGERQKEALTTASLQSGIDERESTHQLAANAAEIKQARLDLSEHKQAAQDQHANAELDRKIKQDGLKPEYKAAQEISRQIDAKVRLHDEYKLDPVKAATIPPEKLAGLASEIGGLRAQWLKLSGVDPALLPDYANPSATAPAAVGTPLSTEKAKEYLTAAKGDKNIARQLALKDGHTL